MSSIIEKLRREIRNFTHLESCDWFHYDTEFQCKLLQLVNMGYARKIDVTHVDFYLQIDKLYNETNMYRALHAERPMPCD